MLQAVRYLFILVFQFSLVHSGTHQFEWDENEDEVISLTTAIEVRESIQNFSRLVNEGEGHTTVPGMPELPSFSTFYKSNPQKNYRFELEILESITLNDIKVLPHQGIKSNWKIEDINQINHDFYNSAESFPFQNIWTSDRIPGRGLEMIHLQVIPFSYRPSEQKLEVYTRVNIHIIEDDDNSEGILNQPLRSRSFDQLYKNIVINFEEADREEDYQDPAILYICGGSSQTNSDFQNLIEWRKQRGYTVYTASTSETGSSSSSIKNYIQNAYNTFDPAPEFVALVGDVDGSFTIPTYYNGWGHNSYGNECEGDHPYSQLDGNDLIPEVLVGRMSIRTSSELSVVTHKIINYEKTPYLDSIADYYEKAAMAGDPSTSGNSCAITKEYIAETLEAHGFEDVRLKTSGGSWSSWMENQLEEGVLFFNYRGYIGMSGFENNDVDGANNGFKLPFATVLTCGTGSFSEESTTMSEKLFRAGTQSNPKGAVAAIGTATWNTHTLFNNIMDMGIYDGLLADNVQTAGAALASGKLALLNTYPTNPYDWVSAFTQWNNLMGDPATHLFTDTPVKLSVTHHENISAGTNFLDVEVVDENGTAVDDARVTMWNRFLPSSPSVFTNELGQATLDLSGLTLTNFTVTVTKDNHQPYQGDVTVQSTGAIVTVNDNGIIIDDGNGNNDGTLNPGEAVQIHIPLSNTGTEDITGVSAILSSSTDLVSINTGEVQYGTLNVGESSTNSFWILLASSAIQNEELGLRLGISDDSGNQWESEIRIDVQGSFLVIEGGSFIEPGQSASFNLQLTNLGTVQEWGIFAELSFEGNQIEITDGEGLWYDIPAGESGTSWDGFEITAVNDIINGTILPLTLHIQSGSGYDRMETLNLQVGTVSVVDPLGPDQYGYYIYDSGDTSYDLAPIYNWIEIDPTLGGSGNDLNLSNSGDGNWSGNGPIAHVNLPFSFRFYGIDYNEITVCTNGWVALGYSEMESFRNYPIPGAGGPSPMIAAFWDDLETGGSGDVITYHDNNNDQFIIEWSDMRTQNNNSLETLQLILINDSSPPYGDGNIKIQYKEFNNTSSGIWNTYPPIHGGYATIGIENHLGDQGLQYTFNNQYPAAAMRLEDESALYITTSPPVSLPSPGLSYSADNLDFTLEANQSASSALTISNTGEEGSVLTYSVSKSGIPPFDVVGGGPDAQGYIWSDSDLETGLSYSWMNIEGMGNPSYFPQNDTGADPVDMGFSFNFYGQEYTQCVVNPNGWIGFGSDNTAFSNTTLPSASAPQPAIFGFWDDLNPVSDDQGGCPQGSGNVYTYSNGSQFVVWFNDVGRCANTEQYQGVYDFQFVLHSNGDIDLNYRDMSGYTTSSTIGMQNESGSVGLQVSYNSNYTQSQLSLNFRKQDDVNWLTLEGTPTGELANNESAFIDVTASSTGLDAGDYAAEITLSTNTQSAVVLPVTLIVSEGGLLGDLNDDGLLNVLDVVSLVNIILYGGEYVSQGDMNQDGNLDILDVVTLVNLILA